LYSTLSFAVLVWGAYAVAEVAFLVVRPLAAGYEQMMLPIHWRFLGISIGAYLIGGAALGALAGWIRDRIGASSAEGSQRLAVLTLVLAYLLNLAPAAGPWAPPNGVALALGAIALVGALGGLLWPRLDLATRPLSDPWTVAVLLVAGPLTAPRFGPAAVGGVLVAGAAAFAISSFVLQRGRRLRASGIPVRQVVALAAALPAVVLAIPVAEPELGWVRRFERTAAAGTRPNVVLIVMDTVRADHLSSYGYPRKTTPNLDRFASRATLYRHAFAASNFTLPSHASMFTGLYPRTHGATNLPPGLSDGEPLDPKFETLAEKLAGQGYLNLAVVANYSYLTPDFGFRQGFHFYDARYGSMCLPYMKRHSLRFALRRLLPSAARPEALHQRYRSATEINREVFALLDQAAEAQAPFFLFVNYTDPHDPYIPPPPYDTLFEGRNQDLDAWDRWALYEALVDGNVHVTEEEKQHFTSQYDGAIAYLDSQIGRLLEELDKRGLFDNTMIIVTSDHGEALGDGGYLGHGWTLHNHQVRVPLIIKYPGQRAGRASEINAGHVDLMPTVLDVVGIGLPGNLQGASLLESDAQTDPLGRFIRKLIWEPKRSVIRKPSGGL
jgi:arylsulfatase A-like enzyme